MADKAGNHTNGDSRLCFHADHVAVLLGAGLGSSLVDPNVGGLILLSESERDLKE
jgi:hypothetical protein